MYTRFRVALWGGPGSNAILVFSMTNYWKSRGGGLGWGMPILTNKLSTSNVYK